jgi:signal transduction histidine kinase/DNA-binding response OmpR family regulator
MCRRAPYTFRVKGSNNDAVWNTMGASVIITITPPWWQTNAAYLIYALAFAAALYGLRHYTLSRERLKTSLKLQRIESEKLQEIDRLKSHFFANISHEFRTPLTLILSPLEKLLSAPAGQAPPRTLYQTMHRNASRLLTLVNQLLDLSKLEAGKMKPEYKEGDLVQFLKRTVFSFSSLAERKYIGFEVRCPEARLQVYFDEDKLEKIITNLISNAFKFTPEGGAISVTIHISPIPEKQIHTLMSHEAKTKGAIMLEFTVEDTGIGIAEEMLPKIFDRFYQADASHTLEGTGIGLSLVRELVELQGGKITVKSELGKGTMFTVKLPLMQSHFHQPVSDGEPLAMAQGNLVEINTSQLPIVANPAADALTVPTDKDAPLILIVEDNGDIREFIRQSLHLAYRMVEAADGEQGYKLAIETIPDLILSDVMMPRMDGMALCHKLKGDEKTSHIPVVLLTAKASGESKVEGLETGADDYIIKPFEARELQVRIKNLIDGRKKLQDHYSRQITLQPAAIEISSADERFLQKAMQVVEAHMADASFGVEEFGEELCMSRMQLFRKLKALTNQSPGDFIKQMRLKRAAYLLSKGSGTIAEISYKAGFNSPSYFTKCFVEQYGKTPSEFIAAQSQLK